MLMEIVSAFGPLAAYRFLFNEELGGPCAFLEYTDHSITSKACAGLSGMKLGGCILTAVHVFPNPPAELNFQVDNEASPFYGIPDNAKSLLEEPTKVLQLKDVVCCSFVSVCVKLLVRSTNTSHIKIICG
uniref:RRM domain-containing protein n=1 Tax=Arundo donax TaxID=35708 RepID=A0A0A9D5Z5_ARUDO